MSSLLARILLAIIMMPLAVIVYIAACFAFSRRIDPFYMFIWAGITTAVFVVLWWLSLWRSSVRWTPGRKWGTFLAGPAAILIGGGFGFLLALGTSTYRVETELVALTGSTVSILSWLALTILIWRETAAERIEQLAKARGDVLACPNCGYNMTGLNQARCPECGQQYTLNQLYAAQHRPIISDAASTCQEQA